MTADFLIVLACCVLGLLAHGSRHQGWIAWLLRAFIGLTCAGEFLSILGWLTSDRPTDWGFSVLVGMCVSTGLMMFMPIRQGLSYVLTVLNQLINGQVLLTAWRKGQVSAALHADKIYVPNSMPHVVALWIYISAAGFLLSSIDPRGMQIPAMPIPLPVPIDQLISYNGLGLVLLAFCGVGIFVGRKFPEVLQRLGWVKPTWAQVGIGALLIVMTFGYDYIWSLFTHQMSGDLGSKLSGYNSGTFNAGGGAGPAMVLALATALCAGIGEETIIRGALQPVFGIFPAALLHGLLHGQFSHAPMFILQVTGWSTLMGIARRYTNTTTTIIGHAGFNFITTFLFAFNP